MLKRLRQILVLPSTERLKAFEDVMDPLGGKALLDQIEENAIDASCKDWSIQVNLRTY